MQNLYSFLSIYYCHSTGTFTPTVTYYILQARQLYYDPEGGTYYEFDTETCQYQVHSRVKLSKKTARSEEGLEKVVDLCSSSDSEDEGGSPTTLVISTSNFFFHGTVHSF